MKMPRSFRLWAFKRYPDKGFPLFVTRYNASLLDPEFMNVMRFMRGSDDHMTFDLLTMPGFKWKREIDEWMKARDCHFKVELELKPTISEQKHDRMTIRFFEEQDAMEFKLTFL
jgi:hypothetical protein